MRLGEVKPGVIGSVVALYVVATTARVHLSLLSDAVMVKSKAQMKSGG